MSYGISSSGFSRPRLADLRTEIEQVLFTTLGSEIAKDSEGHIPPETVLGQLVGVMADRLDQVWQGMEDDYNSKYPDTAFGVSLDNVGALSGIPRKGALPTRVRGERLFGTASTLVAAGTQLRVVGFPDYIFETDADVTLVAGQNTIQDVDFSAVPDAGQWKLTWYGQETAALAFNDNAAAVQAAIRALPFAGGVNVTGDYTAGFTFDFAGVSGLQDWPAMTVSLNTLTASSVAVTTSVTMTQAGINQGSVDCTQVSDPDVAGPINALAGTLTEIVTPVAGLTSVLNVTDAVVGRSTETDNEYRARRAVTLQVAGAGTPEAIRARLLELTDVTAAFVFENDSMVVDLDGRQPKSFEAVVQGGDEQEIADLLWQIKPAGIRTEGSITKSVTDSMGQTQTLRFSRPTGIPIYVKLTLTINPAFPANGVALAKQYIVAAGDALGIGTDVVVLPYLMAAIASIPGIDNAVMYIGLAPSPSSSAMIPIGVAEISEFDTTRVDVITV